MTELAGEDMDLSTAKKLFVREVIYHLQSFKATYNRQNELYQKRFPATMVPLNDQGFVQKLLVCSRVPDPEVQAAARSALSEFRPRTRVKKPVFTH